MAGFEVRDSCAKNGVDKVSDKDCDEVRIYSNVVERFSGGMAAKLVQRSAIWCNVVQSTAKEDEAGSQI